jgi:hypothetical protein
MAAHLLQIDADLGLAEGVREMLLAPIPQFGDEEEMTPTFHHRNDVGSSTSNVADAPPPPPPPLPRIDIRGTADPSARTKDAYSSEEPSVLKQITGMLQSPPVLAIMGSHFSNNFGGFMMLSCTMLALTMDLCH